MKGDFDTFLCGNARAVIYTQHSPTKLAPNQDAAAAFCLDDNNCVLAVADGLGGMPKGDKASEIAMHSLLNVLTSKLNNNLRDKLIDGIEHANKEILDLGVGAGTTIACAEISNNILRPYHVGDSIILVVGQRGKIKLYTTPHSTVAYAIKAGVISEEEAMHHSQRHIVLNSAGHAGMHIEIGSPLKLAKYDTVLLASDGLLDNFYIHEIIELIRKGPLDKIANSLIHICADRMHGRIEGAPSKPDDLTFILYRCSR